MQPALQPLLKIGVTYLAVTTQSRTKVCYFTIKSERERRRWQELRRISDFTLKEVSHEVKDIANQSRSAAVGIGANMFCSERGQKSGSRKKL